MSTTSPDFIPTPPLPLAFGVGPPPPPADITTASACPSPSDPSLPTRIIDPRSDTAIAASVVGFKPGLGSLILREE